MQFLFNFSINLRHFPTLHSKFKIIPRTSFSTKKLEAPRAFSRSMLSMKIYVHLHHVFPYSWFSIQISIKTSSARIWAFPSFTLKGSGKCFFCVHVCCSFPPRFGCSWKEMKNWLYLYEWEKWRQIGSISRTNLTIGYLRNATYIVDQYTRIFVFKSFRELQIIWFNVMNF